MSDASKSAVPFLKWPGGKRWLAPALAPVLRTELRGTYFEPFLGGGAVFLELRPTIAVLSDINTDLIEFLSTVVSGPDDVVNATWRFSNTADCYYRVRSSTPRSKLSRAARFLFLNRTAWGGVYRLNRKGEFNVPFGNSGRVICSKGDVRSVAKALNTASLKVRDFESSFAEAVAGDVVYADPPYTSRGECNGFVRYNERLFRWSDQVRLSTVARAARRRGVFVAVSGVFHRDVMSLYENWWAWIVERPSAVARERSYRRMVTEIVMLSRKPDASVVPHGAIVCRATRDFIESIPHHP